MCAGGGPPRCLAAYLFVLICVCACVQVESLAIDTLAAAASSGFAQDAIEASMNTIEFQMRECSTGGFPKGLSFMLGDAAAPTQDRASALLPCVPPHTPVC